MEDISQLIKEAKPLYFARKRRNNFIKGSMAALFLVAMVGLFNRGSAYVYPYADIWSEEIVSTSEGSVIAEMGLPTDDYGLLMVV